MIVLYIPVHVDMLCIAYNIFYIIVYDPPDQCTVCTVDEEYIFLLFQVSGLHFWVCKYSRLAFPQTV